MAEHSQEAILNEYNPYWTKRKYQSALIPRSQYTDILIDLLQHREIIALKGIRRCGKSSVLNLLIDRLLKNEVPANNILYINLEDFRLGNNRDIDLLNSIYNEYISLKKPQNKHYILLDEIQIVSNFERWLRTLYDNNSNARFIITGSSSELLSGELATLLSGRHLSVEIFPFSFKEYLQYKNSEILETYSKRDMPELDKKISQKMINALQKYMQCGGFPEIMLSTNTHRNKLLLQQYLEDILLKDIAKRYNIRDLKTLEKLALYILSNIGNEISVNRISNLLNSSRQTINVLLNYLKQVYLVYFTANFSFSLNERLNMKKPQKIYSIDTGMFSALKQTVVNDYGKMAENLAFLHLKNTLNEDVYFWKQKIEIDFILNNGLPLNVTFTDKIPEREYEGLFYYLEKHNLNHGFLLTKNLFEQYRENEKTIHVLPLWHFLLCDHFDKSL